MHIKLASSVTNLQQYLRKSKNNQCYKINNLMRGKRQNKARLPHSK